MKQEQPQDDQKGGCPQGVSPQARCLPPTQTAIYTKCLLFSHWPVTSQREKDGTKLAAVTAQEGRDSRD